MIRALMFLLAALSGAAQAKTVVYVSNAEDGTVGIYALDQTKGTLTPQTTIQAGPMAMPMAVDPNRHFLYVGLRQEPFRVATFAIGADGGLSKQGEAPLGNMAYLATDKTGRWLLGASYNDDKVSVSPVGEAATQVLTTGRHAHAILPDASNRFAFVTNLGDDQILQYRFDAASGTLSPNDPALIKTDAGQGPRHLAFSPDSRFLYVITELTGDVVQFALDPNHGTLRRVGAVSIIQAGAAPAKVWAADLKITPDGRFLYATERTDSRIVQLAIDPRSGTPHLVGTIPTETQPRGIAIAPSGRFLVASGEKSEQISLYRIDKKTGALTLAAKAPGGKDANWVEIVDLR